MGAPLRKTTPALVLFIGASHAILKICRVYPYTIYYYRGRPYIFFMVLFKQRLHRVTLYIYGHGHRAGLILQYGIIQFGHRAGLSLVDTVTVIIYRNYKPAGVESNRIIICPILFFFKGGGGNFERKMCVDTRINACTHKYQTNMQLFLHSFSRGLSSIFCFVLLFSFIFEMSKTPQKIA